MMRPLVVFRADASAAVGSGHVVRCLALAGQYATLQWRCGFACAPGSPAVVTALADGRLELLQLDGPPEAEPAALRRRWPEGADLLVVDHYGRDGAFEIACRGWARRILAIDDYRDRPHAADFVLDPTPRAPADDAVCCAGRLDGPAHALLGPAFRRLRQDGLRRRREAGPVRRILVSLGGTDPDGLTSAVLSACALSGVDAALDVVSGPAAPHLEQVRAALARLPQPAELHVGTARMAELMATADLAIGAGGGTALERCCLGLPSLVLVAAENQQEVVAGLVTAGAARPLAPPGRFDAAYAAAVLADLAADGEARRTMAERAAALCDGAGVFRTVLALLGAEPAADGGAVRLRPLAAGNAELTYRWQQDPSTRRFARNPAVPTPAEHRAWLDRLLAQPARLACIVLHDERPAGVLRLDPCEGEAAAWEIGILVAAEARQAGVALAALALAKRLVGGGELRAVVLPENRASHALFRKAGFADAGPYYLYRCAAPAAEGEA